MAGGVAQSSGNLEVSFESSRPIATFGQVILLIGVGSFLASAAYEVIPMYLIVVFGVLVAITAFLDFEMAFLYIPLSLTNPYTLGETGTRLHISELTLLIIISVWVIRSIPFRESIHFPRQFLVPSIVIVVASTLSLFAANYLVEGVQQIVRYIEVLIILFAIFSKSMDDNPVLIRRIFLFLIIGGFFASLVGLSQFLSGSLTKGATRRIFGWHGGGFGALMASTLLMSISALFFGSGRGLKFWALLAIPFTFIALILSQTRTWIGALGIALAILLLRHKRRVISPVMWTLAIVTVSLVLILETDAFGLVDRKIINAAVSFAFRFGMTPGKYSVDDVSLLLRFSAWNDAIQKFVNHPITGIGVGNLRYEDYLTLKLGKPGEGVGFVDNQYLQFFTEAGFFAGLSWMVFVYNALKIGWRALQKSEGGEMFYSTFGIMGSLLVFAIGGCFWVITPHHELFAIMILNITLLLSTSKLTQDGRAAT